MSRNIDKLKQFFRSNKTNSAQERVWFLTPETERELQKDPIEKRTKTIRDLTEIVVTNRLEEVTKCTYS